jgi:adenine phosphoribosyltransferase
MPQDPRYTKLAQLLVRYSARVRPGDSVLIDAIAIHTDAVKPGSRVLLIDDLLATGGTAEAAALLLEKVGAKILEAVFLIELKDLNGRGRIKHCPVRSLVVY